VRDVVKSTKGRDGVIQVTITITTPSRTLDFRLHTTTHVGPSRTLLDFFIDSGLGPLAFPFVRCASCMPQRMKSKASIRKNCKPMYAKTGTLNECTQS
jgi:hypothetical protein